MSRNEKLIMGAKDSSMKLKRKKDVKKKREEILEKGESQVSKTEGSKTKDKRRKKKYADDAKVIVLSTIKETEMPETTEGNKKDKKLRDSKKKNGKINKILVVESNISDSVSIAAGRDFGKNDAANVAIDDKMQNSRKKKRKDLESFDRADALNKEGDASEQGNDKTKKSAKKKKKRQSLEKELSQDNFLGKRDAVEEVYQMSSEDEDCSKGMKKWITQYHDSRPGIKVLQERIDAYITAHEAREEQARKEREAQAAEGGWTVVVHHKGKKRTTDAESGIAVGTVSQAAVLNNIAKKKNKEAGLDFYRFQRREAQKNEILMLQSKFEQDKKRIQQMRAARKFRPY